MPAYNLRGREWPVATAHRLFSRSTSASLAMAAPHRDEVGGATSTTPWTPTPVPEPAEEDLDTKVRRLRTENVELAARLTAAHERRNGLRRQALTRTVGLTAKRRAVQALIVECGASERQACRLLGQHRSTQRYRGKWTRPAAAEAAHDAN